MRIIYSILILLLTTSLFSQVKEFDVDIKSVRTINDNLELILNANQEKITSLYSKNNKVTVCTEYYDNRKPECSEIIALKSVLKNSHKVKILDAFSTNLDEYSIIVVHGNTNYSIISRLKINKNENKLLNNIEIIRFDVPKGYYKNKAEYQIIYDKDQSKIFIGEYYLKKGSVNTRNAVLQGVVTDKKYNLLSKISEPIPMQRSFYFSENGDIITTAFNKNEINIYEKKI